MIKKNYSQSETEALLKKNKFGVFNQRIYGKKATGTNGTGGAIDFLVSQHGYVYLPDAEQSRH